MLLRRSLAHGKLQGRKNLTLGGAGGFPALRTGFCLPGLKTRMGIAIHKRGSLFLASERASLEMLALDLMRVECTSGTQR
jgi:hypothetical protein